LTEGFNKTQTSNIPVRRVL